ncbi:MAG: glycosyltransferase family 39 protein [Anaerolineae bacterium]
MKTKYVSLAVIGGVYLLLALVYAWVTPLFETPDETWHFWYVKHLADGQGLAVVTADERPLWRQEGTQPPLYYLLGAALIRGIDTSNALDVIQRNPHANIGRADLPGNRNSVLPVSRAPFQGAAEAAQTVRWLSVILGLVTVLSVYGLAQETFPDDNVLPAAAALFVVFVPQFLFLSGSINNDNLIIALSSLALWRLVHWLRRPPRWGDLLALGVIGGLAALSKLSGLALIGFVVAVVSLRALTRRSLRDFLAWNAALLALPLAIAGWFYWRNFTLYGDPLALDIHLTLSGRRTPRPSPWQLFLELDSVRHSFWGVFGWFNVPVPPWMFAVYDALSIAALVGMAIGVWRLFPHPPAPSAKIGEEEKNSVSLARSGRGAGVRDLGILALLLAWVGVVFVSLLRWMSLIKSAQGRLLFPAIGAVAVLAAWGLSQLAPRHRAILLGGVLAVMGVLAAAIPFLVIAPAYAAPPWLPDIEAASPAYRLNDVFGGKVRLLGYDAGSDVAPGGLLPVTLYWQAAAPMDTDYSLFAQLVGSEPGGGRVAGTDTYPGLGSEPTRGWPVGPVLRDTLYIPVGEKVAAPRSYPLVVGVYDRAKDTRLKVTRDGQPAGDSVELGSVFVQPEGWSPPNSQDVVFGSAAQLAGYDLGAANVRPGDTVPLTLYWRAAGPLPADYTVFVHVGDSEPLVAQADAPPLAGHAPSANWRPGQTIADTHALRIRPDAAPGVYPVRVGLYDPATGARLPVTDGGVGDTTDLGTITVGN